MIFDFNCAEQDSDVEIGGADSVFLCSTCYRPASLIIFL